MDTKDTDPRPSFRDTKGREWSTVFSVGLAQRLRDQVGLDVDSVLRGDRTFIETLISDPFKLVEALELATESQRLSREVSRTDFLESLSGDSLDEGLTALIAGLAASMGKLKRRPLLALAKALSARVDQATEKIEAQIETELRKLADVDLVTGHTSPLSPVS